jgi:hypothetical protein
VTLGVIAALRGPSRGIAITRASIVGRHRAPGHLGQGVGGVGLAWLVTPFQSSGLEDGLLQRGQAASIWAPPRGCSWRSSSTTRRIPPRCVRTAGAGVARFA